MRRYECLVLLDPDVPDDDIRAFSDRFGELIKSTGGEIIKIEDWGPKKLAYLVRKRDKGRYILFDFVGLPALILEMERRLKITDEVMKFLSIMRDDSVNLDAFKESAAKAEAPAPAAEAAPAVESAPAVEPTTEPSPTSETPVETVAETVAAPTEGEPATAPAEEPQAASAPTEEGQS
jgi:small subunit ribosomal protein S6